MTDKDIGSMFLQEKKYGNMPDLIGPFRDFPANRPGRSDNVYPGRENCDMSDVKLTSVNVAKEVTEA